MSKKRYMEGKNKALEQIIQEQQSQLETKDFIIDAQTKENDRHVLTFKFIVDILLLISQLERLCCNT